MPGSTDVTVVQQADETVLITVGGRTFEIAANCPHRRGRLAYAHVNANTMRITCPLHRSTFDLTTGCQLAGPASDTLAVRELDRTATSEVAVETPC